jgi:peptide/nickel transport system substrate-binding protein
MVGDIEKYGARGNNEFKFQTAQYVPQQYLTGGVAESWALTTSPDTITFNIRHGIMWAGNTTLGMAPRGLTADDVVYSLKRGFAAPVVAGTYTFVDDVVAKDQYTVVIDCNTFNANWAYFIGYGYMVGMITCPESGNATIGGGSNDWKNQVSDGPFIITDYTSGASCTYTKNPNYWGRTTINGTSYKLPFIQTLIYPIIPDEAASIAALRTAKLDWWPYTPNTYAASLTQTSPKLVQVPIPAGNVLVMNVNRLNNQYLKNLAVRQALETATDFQTILNLEYPGGTLLSYPVAPGDPSYTALADLPTSTKSQFTYNPTLAKQMLSDAGYPNGFSVTLNTLSTDATEADVAQLLVSQWAKVGITLTINPTTQAALEADRMSIGYDLLFHVYNVNNPITSLDNMYQGGQNTSCTYLASEPYTAEYKAIIADTDLTKLAADEKQLAQGCLADAGLIPFANPVLLNAYWPWMKNYYGETDAGYDNLSAELSRMWIDQNMKTTMGY